MKKSAIKFLATYFLFVLLFILQKPIFMLFHSDLYAGVSVSDYFDVIYNGLPLDLSLAGYLTIIPGVLLTITQWWQSSILKNIELGYYIFISIVMSLVMCIDTAIYGFWDMKLDMTPIFYFTSSPSSALASVSTWYIIGGVTSVIVLSLVYSLIFYFTVLRINPNRENDRRKKIKNTIAIVLLTGILFIPIRGGFTVSTMNLSAAYYSQNQRLNHAAINPLFSLMYSATHQSNFSEQFRYFSPEECDKLYAQLKDKPATDNIPRILNNTRPDIYIVILESFSSHLMKSLNGTEPIAENLDAIAGKGILFTNFYANGFRTDRAIPAILSAYPSQPTTSIMKYVTKTDHLPSIPKTLKQNGYRLAYFYGGDINFTNMNAYLISSGFEKIISDKDFSVNERLSKWGAHDHLVFERCLEDALSGKNSGPTLRVIQTSSSHEPFEVPYSALSNKRANAFAYTDNCLGEFVSQLKENGLWENSLLIIVPDHYGAYPKNIGNPIKRHQVPLIFAGGVVTHPQQIDVISSQVDIAATLLYQMGISYEEFVFSKNILNPSSPHFAFFVDNAQFGMIDSKNQVVYNCDGDMIVCQNGDNPKQTLKLGKAYLQKLYDDLDKR